MKKIEAHNKAVLNLGRCLTEALVEAGNWGLWLSSRGKKGMVEYMHRSTLNYIEVQ